MRRILYYVIGIAVVFFGWHRYQQMQLRALGAADAAADPVVPAEPPADTRRYRCEGVSRCAQLHSCEEAAWVLRNCPGVTLDGEAGGASCEKQWCGPH